MPRVRADSCPRLSDVGAFDCSDLSKACDPFYAVKVRQIVARQMLILAQDPSALQAIAIVVVTGSVLAELFPTRIRGGLQE